MDCLPVKVTLAWDRQRQEWVCNRCHRMYSDLRPESHKIYTEKKWVMKRIRKDQRERGNMSLATKELGDRIIRNHYE